MNNLSVSSKMPCNLFDLDLIASGCAMRCMLYLLGICYAKNNPKQYTPKRKAILARNMELLNSNRFVSEMRYQILAKSQNVFRFFGSGDFPDVKSMEKIFKLASSLPDVKFWIPTSRDDLLKEFIDAGGKIPDNVCVRYSSPAVNLPVPQFLIDMFEPHGIVFSQITTDLDNATCQASKVKKGNCKICRDCWNRDVKFVKYFVHGNKAQSAIKKYLNTISNSITA